MFSIFILSFTFNNQQLSIDFSLEFCMLKFWFIPRLMVNYLVFLTLFRITFYLVTVNLMLVSTTVHSVEKAFSAWKCAL